MTILSILLGLILLAFGHKLFWLLVGALGFVAGMTIATRYFHNYPDSHLLIAFAVAAVGALLAIFLQKVAVGVAGFVGGGYLALTLAERFGWAAAASTPWLPFVIGGVLGALLAGMVFKWALIVLTSVAGAVFIVQPFNLGGDTMLIAIGLLSIGGIAFQAGALTKKPPPQRQET